MSVPDEGAGTIFFVSLTASLNGCPTAGFTFSAPDVCDTQHHRLRDHSVPEPCDWTRHGAGRSHSLHLDLDATIAAPLRMTGVVPLCGRPVRGPPRIRSERRPLPLMGTSRWPDGCGNLRRWLSTAFVGPMRVHLPKVPSSSLRPRHEADQARVSDARRTGINFWAKSARASLPLQRAQKWPQNRPLKSKHRLVSARRLCPGLLALSTSGAP